MERVSMALALMAAVVASGCATQAQGPDPVVVNSNQQQGVLDAVQGQATVEADIRNRGGPGTVEATVTILDAGETVLDRVSEQFEMEANETRRIQIQTEVPEGAESYNLTVEPR